MKKLLLLPFLALALLITGCAHRLETGGAYSPTPVTGAEARPDYPFYVAEASYDLAYSAYNTAVTFEKRNAAFLWELNPNIKRELDKIRPDALTARDAYFKARKAYLAKPVPANLTQLETVLATFQQLSAAAAATLPK
jgi:hypothetical protein